MNSNGDIVRLTDEDLKAFSAKQAKKLIPIPLEELAAVERMNHQQRRAWYSDQRRKLKRSKKAAKRSALKLKEHAK